MIAKSIPPLLTADQSIVPSWCETSMPCVTAPRAHAASPTSTVPTSICEGSLHAATNKITAAAPCRMRPTIHLLLYGNPQKRFAVSFNVSTSAVRPRLLLFDVDRLFRQTDADEDTAGHLAQRVDGGQDLGPECGLARLQKRPRERDPEAARRRGGGDDGVDCLQ